MRASALSKLAMPVALSLLSTPALASPCPDHWLQVASDYKNAQVCIDMRAVALMNGLKSVPWMVALDNEHDTGAFKYRSVVHMALVECQAAQAAITGSRFFAGPRGTGSETRQMRFSKEALKWEPLPSAIAREVCTSQRKSQ